MSLFEDCERTHLGRSRLHESEYAYPHSSEHEHVVQARPVGFSLLSQMRSVLAVHHFVGAPV